MKIVFVVNNKNNRLGKVLPKLEQHVQRYEGSVEFFYTLQRGHGIELAKEATEKGCEYLIAVGGDGTLNEVINGLIQSVVPGETYPTIGLLPYGSANDFARTAGVTQSIDELMALIQSNSSQAIDIGKIISEKSGSVCYFINIASLGLGPEVVKRLNDSSSKLSPALKYFKYIIKAFLNYDKKEVSCSSNSWQWKGPLLQMAVANGRYYGNAVKTAPDAELSDGQFQVAIFGNLSIWDYLKNFNNLKKGIKIDHAEVSYRVAPEVMVESKDSCGIEADGEYVGLAPATITIVPKAIRFLMRPNSETRSAST